MKTEHTTHIVSPLLGEYKVTLPANASLDHFANAASQSLELLSIVFDDRRAEFLHLAADLLRKRASEVELEDEDSV